jgi:hypothetical protein
MPAFDADEVNLKTWQLVTAIHHAEGEGLTLCEQLSEGYDHIIFVCYLLWRILCNVT